jgi:hypothetical protein
LHSKGSNHHSKEETYRVGENTANYSFDKGLLPQIYKELKELNTKNQII